METKGILAISKLRKNAFKDNPGCICQFFSSQVCKKPAIFFSTQLTLKNIYFPRNWSNIMLSSISGLKINI